MSNYITAEAAVQLVKSGNRVFMQGGAATPVYLINSLLSRAEELQDVELTSISTYGDIHWNNEAVLNSFYLNSLFVSANVRDWVNSNRGGFVPVFLSEISQLFENGYLPLDVALIQVSPPDAHGFCTLGPSVDVTMSAVRSAKKIIAQVNPLMPKVYGDGMIHTSKIDAMVWQKAELHEFDFSSKTTEQAQQIGRHVASIIEDRSTLQMGIGAIPDAVLSCLTGHKGLGIHTEMFSDGIVPLVKAGVITNEYKKVHRGKIISSFVLGTSKVYDFINDNPYVNCLEASHVNDTSVIRKNPKMVAINSALEIDLTGQVCADSIGTSQYSGIGGQMDFMRGASLSEGGKPIIALPSVTSRGTSRIVPFLKQGAGVVTTRGHIQYVATEYGLVNLYGKNLEQRARLLISIAHPNHREQLEQEYHNRFGLLYKMPTVQ